MSVEGIVEKIRKEMFDEVQAAFERGYAQGVRESDKACHEAADHIERLRAKLDREIEAHRTNVILLDQAKSAMAAAEKRAQEMASAFIRLHDMAKAEVGPKVAPTTPPSECLTKTFSKDDPIWD